MFPSQQSTWVVLALVTGSEMYQEYAMKSEGLSSSSCAEAALPSLRIVFPGCNFLSLYISISELGMVVHTFNLNTQETKADL